MDTWETPPLIKVYEAMGAIADNRVHITSDSEASVTSSDKSKKYIVTFDLSNNAIRANDNGSYWQGYLGYPTIAVLMKLDKLPCNERLAEYLKDIKWKKLNEKNKRDYEKTIEEVLNNIGDEQDRDELKEFTERVLREIEKSQFKKFGKRIPPPR